MALAERSGFTIEEIDECARDILHSIADIEPDAALILLGLCRAITIVATEAELDTACILIDELREADLTELEYYNDEFDEEDDEDLE